VAGPTSQRASRTITRRPWVGAFVVEWQGSIRTATSERGGLPGRGVTTIVHSDGATAGPW